MAGDSDEELELWGRAAPAAGGEVGWLDPKARQVCCW